MTATSIQLQLAATQQAQALMVCSIWPETSGSGWLIGTTATTTRLGQTHKDRNRVSVKLPEEEHGRAASWMCALLIEYVVSPLTA